MENKEKGKVSGFPLATLQDFQNFKEEAETEEGYEVQHEKKDGSLKILTKVVKDCPINILKLVAEIPLNIDTVYNVLHDPDYRKTWDEMMIEGTLIEKLDAFNDVGYYAAKSPVFTISNRDFCNQRSWWQAPDKSEYVIFNHSVAHPKCPEKKGFVRANSISTGYWLRPVKGNDKAMKLVYMTQTDPGGWIPAWVVNSTSTTFAPKMIDNLNRVGAKYDDWRAQNRKEPLPWISTDPYWWDAK